ncbi:MAG: type 1 glutamine amidotransferase [Actinomycetota bacterium]|nr:type 1 glutamine amidotransferase [Actinomycetota bacterium]
MPPHILVLQHSPHDGPQLLGDWLLEAGASLDVRRPFDGDVLVRSLDGFDALISLGGAMAAWEDDVAPWLPATRALLATAVQAGTPTLGICLGAQLLAMATGGVVEPGVGGPEVGAYLTAKRDAAERDPLFGTMPMTPDVMQCHFDVISQLPPKAALLMAGTGYPHQAFRIGTAAWGLQFHIECTAATLRHWAAGKGVKGRLGPELDAAEENMALVWRDFAHRFVNYRPGLPALSIVASSP